MVSLVIGVSSAYAELLVEPFYGMSYDDRRNTIQFDFWNNTISGEIIYDGDKVEFQDLSVMIYDNSFKVRDKQIRIFGDYPIEPQSSIKVINVGERKIDTFYIKSAGEPFVKKVQPIVIDVKQTREYQRLVDVPTKSVIYPKSSVEDDVTKWNISNDTKRSESFGTDKPIQPMIQINDITYVSINEKYTPRINIVNYWDSYTGIKDVTMNMKISRSGVTIQEIDGITTLNGSWNPTIYVVYPVYYPTFCYDVTITATYGNNTDITYDDFVVAKSGYWNFLDEWGIEVVNIPSDEDCNE